MSITILTPTYNRGQYLYRLYLSLLEQNTKDFTWLIVDDGSTDSTKELIENYRKENKIKIEYFYKENGGKHTAINFGIKRVTSPIVGIVDSDDWLTSKALETISKYWVIIKEKQNIAGILGLSAFKNEELIGTEFPQNNWEVSFTDIYLKHKVLGDKAVFFKTEVLRNYPFPEKQGIHFVFEATVWHEMSKKYNVLAVNDLLQYKEYTEEGITRNTYKKDYVKGLAFSFFHLVKNRTYPFAKYPHHFLWNYIHLAINSLLSGESYFNQLSLIDKIIYLMFYPRAYYTYSKLKDKVL